MTENDMAKIARLVAFPGSPDDMMDAIAALRARVAKLERALEEIAERRFLAETMIEIARAALSETVEA